MSALRALFRRLGGLVHRHDQEREFAAELEAHLEMHVEDNLRHGMSAEDARRQALIRLGGVGQTKEHHREGASHGVEAISRAAATSRGTEGP